MSFFKKYLNSACQITNYVKERDVLIAFLKYAALKVNWTRETGQGGGWNCVIWSKAAQAVGCSLGWVQIGNTPTGEHLL